MEAKYIKFKNIFIICILLIFLVSLSTAVASDLDDTNKITNDGNLTVQSSTAEPAVDESNQEMTNDGQSSGSDQLLASSNDEDVLGAAGTFSQLGSIISRSSTIDLDNNYEQEASSQIYVGAGKTIDGHGYYIDAKSKSRIFQISGDGVTLKNIIFKNGRASQGGAIYSQFSITLINCTFVNNEATYIGGGGAICSAGTFKVVDIINCTFNDNYAAGQGGAIYATGGNGGLNIYNSSFNRNNVTSSAMGEGGGAIFSTSNRALSIYDSNFTGNYVRGEGGCVRHSGTLTVVGCRFEGNSAKDGSALVGGNDQTSNSIVRNSTFINNHAVRWGGALQERKCSIYNCIFINNTADDDSNSTIKDGPHGGAVYVRDYVNIYNSQFYNNSAVSGGAIAFEDRAWESEIVGCIFENNTANTVGGAVYIDTAATITISSSSFTMNFAQKGGAIQVQPNRGGTLNIGQTHFNQNWATEKGGAINDEGARLITITYSTFNKNNATYGGAIYSNKLNIQDSEFSQNSALNGDGGAIYNLESMSLDTVTFEKNSASEFGGAFYSPSINAKNIKVYDNKATVGGGIYMDGTLTSSEIENSEFENNNATLNGGAIYWNAVEANIKNTKFISNYAGANGGALYWKKGKGKVFGSTFTSNNALNHGGAIYWEANDGSISSNSLFTSNHAVSSGGAVYVAGSSMKIDSTSFNNNMVDDRGSAVYWYGANGELTGSTVSGKSNYGSIYWHGINGQINDNTFNNDKSVYVCEHATATLKNNKQNWTTLDNYSVYNAGNISLETNTFSNAIHNYGLILTDTSVVVLDNETIVTDAKYYDIYTAVLDDNGNYIKVQNGIINTLDGVRYTATFNNTHYVFKSHYLNLGVHPATAVANFTGLSSYVVKSGVIMYMELDINVTIINYGEKVIINVTIVNTTENGTVRLDVNGQEYNVTITNGSGILTFNNVAPGRYDVTAYYGIFNQTIGADIDYVITLRNSTIIITTCNITAGQKVVINITATNGTTGEVYVVINSKMHVLNLVNSTAQLNLTDIPGGIYPIYATYFGDTRFLPSYNTTVLTVTKLNATLPIIIRNNIFVGETAILNITASSNLTGTFTVYINGKEYTYTKAPISIPLTNLAAGNYTVRVLYSGDGKYNSANNNTTFEVRKRNIPLALSVQNIKVGENETITVTVPSNAKGIVFLTVNGNNYYANVNNTKAVFKLTGLPYGKYNVTATYQEDDIYYSNSTNATFKVDYVVIDPVIKYSVDDNLDVIVNVTVPKDVNGDIIIEVDGKNYTSYIVKGLFSVPIKGLAGGVYPSKMYFANDTKYQAVNKSFNIALKKIDTTIHINVTYIYVGDNATITVIVPTDAKGNVTIRIYSVNSTISNYTSGNYTLNVTNGTAVFSVPGIPYGTYEVYAVYSGDRKYNGGTYLARFNVRKIDPNPYSNMTALSIFVGETATFNITMPSDLNDKVYLTIQNNTYTVNITNGTGQINITGLKYGEPVPVYAEFKGNEKYLGCSREYLAFSVHKISNYPMNITAVTDSSSANITVNIPIDANGTGYFTLDNKTYAIKYTNGISNMTTVTGLDPGQQYVVYAYFDGNDKYAPGSTSKTLNSNKTLNYTFEVNAKDIYVGDVAYIIIYLPNVTNGTVTVKGPGVPAGVTINVNETFVNGTYKFPIYDLPAGAHLGEVTYNGNDIYEASSRFGTIQVSKRMVAALVEYNTTYVGQNLTAKVTLPSDANGTVYITINNNVYNATVINGTAYVIIPGLEAKRYNATLFYSGNEKYNNNTQRGEVRILRISDYLFDVDVMDIYVGDNETIIIKLPSDMDVNATITLPGTAIINQTVQIINGTGNITIPNLTAGSYNVTASIVNSSKYIDHFVIRYFTVSTRDDYLFNLHNLTTVYVRDNITFILDLPKDAIGNVTVFIFNNNYTGEVKNGTATINVTALREGTHTFTISFEQKGKYNYKYQNAFAVVVKKAVELEPNYNATVYVDEDVTFEFKLPGDATGNITITSRGVSYTGTLVNGSVNITIKGYPLESLYSPFISYTGDDKYYSNSTTVTVNVTKVKDYDLNVTVANITVEQDEIVNITLPKDVTEDVLISGNFSDSTYSVKLVNGTAQFVISNLTAGNYSINVRYQGYQKYADKNVTLTFNVRKVVPPISIEFVNNDTVIVVLPQNANGNATVVIRNNESDIKINTQIEIVNGRGVLNVSSLRPGTYSVNATFLGGARYLQNSTTRNITIPKIKDYILPVSVEDIIVGENATIIIVVPENATGFVNITIDGGEVIQVLIIGNNVAIYNATGLKVGKNHVVQANYSNVEYEFVTNSTMFNVEKIKTLITPIIDANVTNITVNVTLTEGVYGGNLTIMIDNKPYVFTNITTNKINLTAPILPGEHRILITYSGDENHTNASTTHYKDIPKVTDYTILVNVTSLITVLDQNVVVVTLPKNITGQVHIYINGGAYPPVTVNSTTGKAILTLPRLASGNYTVLASFSSDIYDYKENTTNFTVIKLNTTIDVQVNNITKDMSEVINITLNSNATGYVYIEINGTVFVVDVDEGTATLTRSNIPQGNYTAVITYMGDNRFNPNSTTVYFTVSKIPVNINITAHDVFIGQEVNFTFETSKPITGPVTVRIDNKDYPAVLYNGKGELIVLGQNVGLHNITVIYAGDDDYLPANDTINVTVYGKLPTSVTVNVTNITVGESVTIHINLTGDVNGTVAIAMLGNPIIVQMVNGTGSYTYHNLTARDYHFTVAYFESEFYLASNATGDFTVFKKESVINVTVADINVDQHATLKINITNGTSGVVLIGINGTDYYANITNGVAELIVKNLAVGNYTVRVTYEGDSNYNASMASTTFKVTKLNSEITVSVISNTPTAYGNDVLIKVTGPKDVTGVATVTVTNGGITQYTVYINNGEGYLTISKPSVGPYNVTAKYLENYKYLSNTSNMDKFEVYMNGTDINVKAHNIYVGQNETIVVTFPKGQFSGNVTIDVGGVKYNASIVYNSTGNISTATLVLNTTFTEGIHEVSAEYTYTDADNRTIIYEGYTTFIVYKNNSTIAINPIADIFVGENVTMTFVLDPSDASGTVKVYVNGVERSIDANNLTLTVPNLSAGKYVVQAMYSGDNKYYASSATANFTVYKNNSTIGLSVADIGMGDIEYINVTVENDAKGYVLIKVNDTNYYAEIVSGVARIQIKDLTNGRYVVNATFVGDDKYYANSTVASFNVTKLTTGIIINGSDIYLGQNEIFNITTTANITEVVYIEVAGKNYTAYIVNGKGTFSLGNLTVGKYNATVYFPGNTKYDAIKNVTSFEVKVKQKAAINVTVADITVGDVITVYVNATEGINGPCYVTIAGVAYTRTLVNGRVNFTVSGLSARDYTVSAFFMGDDKFDACNATSTFKVYKQNTTISLNVSDINIGDVELINVTLAENATGYVLISIGDIHVYADIVNGTAIANITGLDVGKYNVTATYVGDANYNGNSTDASFNVTQLKTTIVIKGSNITSGQVEILNITTSANFTEVITIKIGNNNYTTYVENGVGTLSVYGLTPGDYTAYVYFPGNTKYDAAENSTRFTVVDKKASALNVNVSNIVVGDDAVIYVNVTKGATGDVTIAIGGNTYTKAVDADGKVNFTIQNLSARSYHVTAYYLGDDNYLVSNNTADFVVSKNESTIKVSAKDIKVDQIETISIEITNGATGVVLIDINGTDYYANITNGAAELIVKNLAVGEYNVIVRYNGDINYESSSASTKFNVTKLNSAITLEVVSDKLLAHGHGALIRVTGPSDVTGVAIITVSEGGVDTNHTVYINNGIGLLILVEPEIGHYSVSAKYEENYKYLSNVSNSGTFEVYASGSQLNIKTKDIYVGENETIIVTVEGNYAENVTLVIGNLTYEAPLIYNSTTNNSVATFDLTDKFDAGIHNVKASFVSNDSGRIITHEGTATFIVYKINSTTVIYAIDDIKVGQNVTIKFNVTPGDATGSIIVYVNGEQHIVSLDNLTLTIPDLSAGHYNVQAMYGGDSRYLDSNASSSFNVDKNNMSIELKVSDIRVGETEYINVTVENDAKGYVLININGTHYYAPIQSGVARVDITDLGIGTYDVNATFVGDDKYNGNFTTGSFSVTKRDLTITIVGSNITVGQTEVLNITTSVNITEVVTIKLGANVYTTFVVNGTGSLSIIGLGADTYAAYVYFPGNTQYGKANSSTNFTVSAKKSSAISINVTDITVGDVAVIRVNVTSGATGNVTIVIRGDEYRTAINASGEAIFEIPNLPAREYHVTAHYLGDTYYGGSTTSANFTVNKMDTSISASVTNSSVGSIEFVNVTVNENATGTVLLSIDGAHYYAEIDHGVAKFNITGLLVGDYTAEIKYVGDDYFNSINTTAKITISKVSTLINISGNNITEGQPEVLTIRTSENITALVKVEIDGVNYTTFISEGVGTITISNLTAKDYVATVYYLGDDIYFAADNFTEFTVNAKKSSAISVSVEDITVGDDAVIKVNVTAGATGSVTLVIAGDEYTKELNASGEAEFVIDNLSARDYHVTAHYLGDTYYAESTNSANFTVHKKDAPIEIFVSNSTVGAVEYINVTVPGDATEYVLLTIGDANYYANVTGGVARFEVTGLLAGNYTAYATYVGDANYTGNTTSASFKVSMVQTVINITGQSIIEGMDEILSFEISENITAMVNVEIDGVNVTAYLIEGKGTLTVSNLTAKDYTVTVYYAGDKTYLPSKGSTTFTVSPKKHSAVTVKVDDITVGNAAVIKVNVTAGATGNVTLVIAGDEYTKELNASGEVEFVINGLSARGYHVTARYEGDTYFDKSRGSDDFIVKKIPTSIDLTVHDILAGDTEVITVSVTNATAGEVLLNISGTFYYSQIKDGKATFNVPGLKSGSYVASVRYVADDKYDGSFASKSFKVQPEITLEVGKNDGNSTPITVKFSDNTTGKVNVTIDGKTYEADVANGTATVNVVNATPGKQNVTVTFDDGAGSITQQNQTVDIPKVTGQALTAEVTNIDKTNGTATVVVKGPADAEGNVTVTIGNQTFTAPMKDGVAVVNVTDIPVGSHDVDVTYGGDDKYDAISNRTHISMPINLPTVNVVDHLVRGWNSQFDYEAVFTNEYGEVLVDTDVTFIVNGKSYVVKTESHGIARLSETLPVGEYNITSINPVTGEKVTKLLSIVPRLIENKDITMDFADGSYYTVRVIGDDGNPVGAGEIIDIYVNTIHYVGKTDKNGYARLQINLNPNSYHVTAEYKNYEVANNLVVKQTLKLVKKTIKVKKSAKKIVLKAKLKWSNGKAISGKPITFKFKGKSYNTKTNSKGVAKVKVNKKVIKKLKAGKKYKYSAKYLSNMVKGKVIVKK